MAEAVRYRLRVDAGKPSQPLEYAEMMHRLRDKLARHPNGRGYVVTDEDGNVSDSLARSQALVRAGIKLKRDTHINGIVKIDAPNNAGEGVTVYSTKKVEYLLGKVIVDWALTQLNVRYVWGSSNPAGDDVPGAAFDCSGFTLAGYAEVGVSLPHAARYQYADPQVVNFTNAAHAKPGDLFYAFGRLGSTVDHVGLYYMPGKTIDTRNPINEPVAIRDIDPQPPRRGFGRVVKVNGRL